MRHYAPREKMCVPARRLLLCLRLLQRRPARLPLGQPLPLRRPRPVKQISHLSRRQLWIGVLAGTALGAGIGAAVFSARRPTAPPAPPPWVLSAPVIVPPPPADVLAAQSQAVAGGAPALAALEQRMRAYRAQWRGMPPEVARKHAAADRFIDDGKAFEAARALASIVETAPTDSPGGLADTRRILLQDAYFRLCRLALEAGQAIVSSVQTYQALALGEADDVFATNLRLVRAAASDRTGDTAQAKADRQRLRARFSD
jgi:hypothetical protein